MAVNDVKPRADRVMQDRSAADKSCFWSEVA